LTGQTFGRLTVVEQLPSRNGKIYWVCKCNCGKDIEVLGDKLKQGHTKSCGCLKAERNMSFCKNSRTHGLTKTRLYKIWAGMITRCRNPNRKKHKKDYQDRGITVYPEWYKFEVFQEWALANGYTDTLTIDRIDNDKGYSPENCRWADAKTQANNRTTFCRYITFGGETLTIAQWADRIGVKYNYLYRRLIKKDVNLNAILGVV